MNQSADGMKSYEKDKRTELHMLTNMSDYKGISDIGYILEKAGLRQDICALAITDINSVQAYPDAAYFRDFQNIRILYGLTVAVASRERETPCVVIARNPQGKDNIFRLVTEAYKPEYYWKKSVSLEYLLSHREGVYIGASCEGEITAAVLENKPDYEIMKLMSVYDYIEVQPCENYSLFCDIPDSKELVRKIVDLAEKAGKPVAAVSNAAYVDLCEDNRFCYEAVTGLGPGAKSDTRQLYMRSTAEMLNEFSFLGAEKAIEIVLENPNAIAAGCKDIEPVTEKRYPLHIPNEEEKLKKICKTAAAAQYGDELPDTVRERLELELESISRNGYAGLYLIGKLIADKSKEMGYTTGIRAGGGGSLTTYFCGIGDVNPLPAHYYCPECHHFELFGDSPKNYWYTGYDLADKNCPVCGTKLRSDGFNIPFETFAGLRFDREPDIDISVAREIRSGIVKYLADYFGEENVVQAGEVVRINSRIVFQKLYAYDRKTEKGLFRSHHDKKTEADNNGRRNRVFRTIAAVKRGMDAVPGKVFVIPGGTDMNEITPVEYVKTEEGNAKITHLESIYLYGNLVSFDIIGDQIPGMLKALEDKTGFR